VEIAPAPVYEKADRPREPHWNPRMPRPVNHNGMVERLRTLSDAELRALGRALGQVEAERFRPPRQSRRPPRRPPHHPPHRTRDGLAAGPVERGYDPARLLAALIMALVIAAFVFGLWHLVRARQGLADVRPASSAIAAAWGGRAGPVEAPGACSCEGPAVAIGIARPATA